jgi:hypothetical protein
MHFDQAHPSYDPLYHMFSMPFSLPAAQEELAGGIQAAAQGKHIH